MNPRARTSSNHWAIWASLGNRTASILALPGHQHNTTVTNAGFAEDQGRYIIEITKKDLKKVTDILNKNAVHFDELGTVNENELFINEKTKVTIDELKTSNTSWLTKYMSK